MTTISYEPRSDSSRVTHGDLIRYFYDGIKPYDEHLIGFETEQFLVDPKTLEMAGFEQIKQTLDKMAEMFDWERIFEDGHLVALSRGQAMIGLEPGGQLEIASPPVPTLHDEERICKSLDGELSTAAKRSGFGLLSIGLHPTEDIDSLPMIPRKRYAIMAEKLERRGELARWMMRGTCGWQASYDYASEEDFILKFKSAYAVTSIVSAIFANSRWDHGRPNGFASKRVHVWRHTDPTRTGFIPAVFSGRFGFREYCEYALDVPMFFIIRDGKWIDVENHTFRNFLENGYKNRMPAIEDWKLHLTTLFPEIRLKNIIEIRGIDAGRGDFRCCYPAIFTGIFASDETMRRAIGLSENWTYPERIAFHQAVALRGLVSLSPAGTARELADELIAIAIDGLRLRGLKEEYLLEGLLAAIPLLPGDDWIPLDPKHLEPMMISNETAPSVRSEGKPGSGEPAIWLSESENRYFTAGIKRTFGR